MELLANDCLDQKTLIENLIKASAEFDPVEANRSVKYGQTNFKYANVNDCIAATKAHLLKYNLLLMFITSNNDKLVTVRCKILSPTGSSLLFEPITLTAKSSSATDIGAAITYARRYAIVSALNLAVEEPDIEQIEGAKHPDFETAVIQRQPKAEPVLPPSQVAAIKNDAVKAKLLATIRVLYANSTEQKRDSISNALNFAWAGLNNMSVNELTEIKDAFNDQ